MRRAGIPSKGELVVCRIVKIYPNSAFAELIEYEATGMIHVSEVASRWVKNIREFIKENQYVVCRVMDIEGKNVSLSIKRVHRDQANRRLNEFKNEKKSEKLLELTAKSVNKTLEQAYEEAGYDMQENFGSLTKAFEIAAKNQELFRSRIKTGWIDALIEAAKKSQTEKVYEMSAELSIVSYRPDGIEVIRRVLMNAEDGGAEIRYVSSPRYVLIMRGRDPKELESRIVQAAEEAVKEVEKSGGEASFKLEK